MFVTEKLYCDCVDECQRSGRSDDGRKAYWTPYLPDYVEGHEKVCKMTENEHFHMRMRHERRT